MIVVLKKLKQKGRVGGNPGVSQSLKPSVPRVGSALCFISEMTMKRGKKKLRFEPQNTEMERQAGLMHMHDTVLNQMVQFQKNYYEPNQDIPTVVLIDRVQAARGMFVVTVLVLKKKDAGATETCGDILEIIFDDTAGFLARLADKLLQHTGFRASASLHTPDEAARCANARNRAYAAIIRAYEYQAQKSVQDYQHARDVYERLARHQLPGASVEYDATDYMYRLIKAALPDVVITVNKPPTKTGDGLFTVTVTVDSGRASTFLFADVSELLRRLIEAPLDELRDDAAKAHAFEAGIKTFEHYARYTEERHYSVRDMTSPLVDADKRGRVIDADAVVDRSRENHYVAKERRSSASGCTLL